MYGFLLYTDGFNDHKSIKDMQSVGKGYIRLLGLHCNYLKRSASVRVLHLSASKLNINQVLSIIIDDIVEGPTEDFNGLDPLRQKVLIFLDILFNVREYPAADAWADLMSRSADTSCSVCIIECWKRTQNVELVYSSYIDRRNLSIVRLKERMSIMTPECHKLRPVVSKLLGVNCCNVIAAKAK